MFSSFHRLVLSAALLLSCQAIALDSEQRNHISRDHSPNPHQPSIVRDHFLDQVPLLEVAKCDGTDETAAIQAFLDKQPMGATVRMPYGKSCYVTDLNIPAGVSLRGSSDVIGNPAGTNAANLIGEIGALLLERTGTIRVNGISGLAKLLILRADNGMRMQLPASDVSGYAGDCITVSPQAGSGLSARGADGFMIDDVMCIGQSRALVTTSASRYTINRLWYDVNPGPTRAAVTITGSYDSVRVRDLHASPFGMFGKTGPTLHRQGIGLLVAGANDDTQIDGALIIGYDVNASFEGTGAVNVGRLWVDAVDATPKSRGVRFGSGTSNVNIAILNSWGNEWGIEHAGKDGNRNSIGIAHVEGSTEGAVLVTGGNIHIGNLTSRQILPGNSVIRITSATSYVSGLVNDESSGSNAPVAIPEFYTSDKIANLHVVSPYRNAGTPIFGSGTIIFPVIPGENPLKLPLTGGEFQIVDTSTIDRIYGGWGGRRVTLRFINGAKLSARGNILTRSGRDRNIAKNSLVILLYDASMSKWMEILSSP